MRRLAGKLGDNWATPWCSQGMEKIPDPKGVIMATPPLGKISTLGTMSTFLKRGTCSEAMVTVLNRAFQHPALETERPCQPLAGGIMQHGYQCGLVWGVALAAGAEAHRRFGAGTESEVRAILAGQSVVEAFRGQNQTQMNCMEITDLDKSSSKMKMVTYFLIKGGTIGCLRRAARYAPVALREIDAALSHESVEVPPGPVSCAALMARRMGASEEHAVMAAGLAGGIGLSGEACGALGAAIWVAGIKLLGEGATKIAFKAPHAEALIGRFVKCANYEFECSAICGRKFDHVADHASYLRAGGCSKILEGLA